MARKLRPKLIGVNSRVMFPFAPPLQDGANLFGKGNGNEIHPCPEMLRVENAQQRDDPPISWQVGLLDQTVGPYIETMVERDRATIIHVDDPAFAGPNYRRTALRLECAG